MSRIDPFSIEYDDGPDIELARAAVNESDAGALATLLERHRIFIYNVALRMVLNPDDAEDITQEVLLKVITNLGGFRGDSGFRTWLYRITFNHVLKTKKRRREELITDFDRFGSVLDSLPDNQLTPEEEHTLRAAREDTKITCMTGMLLCLDREQRLVWILGEIFGVDHRLGGELLEILPDTYRKRLSRARRDLAAFMDAKCGLVKISNPCRCAKKTKGFIAAGWVDPKNIKFYDERAVRVRELAGSRANSLFDQRDRYTRLYLEHPAHEPRGENPSTWLRGLLASRELRELFELDV